MKRVFIFMVMVLSLLTSCEKTEYNFYTESKTDILYIYCHDQFASSGLSESIISKFEKRYECKVVLVVTEGNEALFQRIVREKSNPQADVVIGIKNTQLFKALDADLFQSYEPSNITYIKDRSLLIDKRSFLIPYAFSYFAFVYNSSSVPEPPKTFGIFQASTYKDKFVLLDPITSATGYSFLLWTTHLYGERGIDLFWQSLKDSIKSIHANMAEVRLAFMYGDAPIILSNSTFPAYYMDVDKNDKIKAVIPEEGGFKDIEYAGILKGSKNAYLAKCFMEYILTRDFQESVPSTLWMYPVVEGIKLPDSFLQCPRPKTDLTEDIFSRRELFSDYILNHWKRMIDNQK